MKKLKNILLLGLSLTLLPMTSCSSFFGDDSDGYMIESTNLTQDPETGITTVVINFTDTSISPLVINIPRGFSGEDGVSIENVTSEIDGEEVLITISYDSPNKSNSYIRVPVKEGKGIAKVDVDYDEDGNTTILFTYTDGTKSDLIVVKKGDDGLGILTIDNFVEGEKTIITIYYTDEEVPPTMVELHNGKGIENIEVEQETVTDYVIAVYYTTGGEPTRLTLNKPVVSKWLSGNDIPTNDLGNDGDYYLNNITGNIYRKVSGRWEYVLCMKGPGSGVVYTVNFDVNGGNWKYNASDDTGDIRVRRDVPYGTYIDLYDEYLLVESTGKTFAGWWTSSDETDVNAGHFDALTPVLKDMTLYARWN